MADSNAQSHQAVTRPLRLTPIKTLQINAVMLGESASPGVRHSRVQQNTSGLPNVSTSVRGDPPFIRKPVVRMRAGEHLSRNAN